jgi:hypothetical protein
MARAQHEPVQPPGVALRPGDNLFDEPAKVDWADMPEPPEPGKYGAYPYDHQYIRLTPDGSAEIVAQWRTTREFTRTTLNWDPVGFWTERNSGGRRIAFEPLGFRRFEE